MSSILDRMNLGDITPEEAMRRRREATEAARRDNRVCVCGHGARSHHSQGYNSWHRQEFSRMGEGCEPAKMKCPCKKFYPVIRVSDVRKFLFRTKGPDDLHALSGAILATSRIEGFKIEEIEGAWKCFRCERTDVRVNPVAYDAKGHEMHEPAPYNVLYCDNCRAQVRQAVLDREAAVAAEKKEKVEA